MENQTVTFNDAKLKAALLQRRDSASAIASRDLKRYYFLLKLCLETHSFSEGEEIEPEFHIKAQGGGTYFQH